MQPNDEVKNATPLDPGYTNGELKSQSIRDIAEGTEPPKEPEKPVEPTEPEKPQEPEVPLEDVVKMTTEQVLAKQKEDQRVADEAKAAEDAKAAEPTRSEEYEQIRKEFVANEGRNPTWDELAGKLEDRAVEKAIAAVNQQAVEAKAKEVEDNTKQAQAQDEENKRLNAFVDDEMAELYNADKLTKIVDANNPSDQGVVERNALFKTWQEVNNKRRAEGKPEIISATRIYDFYYQKPNAQPAGANAPIAGNRSSSEPPTSDKNPGYTNADLKRPWNFFKGR